MVAENLLMKKGELVYDIWSAVLRKWKDSAALQRWNIVPNVVRVTI